jgi:beta-glucuronidase
MEKISDNFQSDIHDTGYEQQFLNPMLNHTGLIDITGRITESLNGQWNFAADWYDTCRRAGWYREQSRDENGRLVPADWDWEAWERMTVPSCWNMQSDRLYYFEGTGIYTRTFGYQPIGKYERIFIRFEGASYRTTVFVNGTCFGTHDGGSTPFSIEITGVLKEQNRIIVTVEAYRRHERVPTENTDWFNYGGLYRDISLIRVPQTFIRNWFLRLLPDGTFSNIRLDIDVCGQEAHSKGTAHLTIPELEVNIRIPADNGTGSMTFPGHPELWSPEHPKLYDFTLAFESGNTPVTGSCNTDIIKDRIGFREIRVQGRNILLNGKSVFLKGISVHEDHLTFGKTTTEKVIRDTIRDLKALNGNYLRLAHYPHDPRFARIAEEEGIMLWEEIPVYWAIAFENPQTYSDAENQLAELILRDRNRASVVIWSVGNENPDTDARLSFMTRLVRKARNLDDSRPVSAACLVNHRKLAIDDRLAEVLDIIGLNEYYGWYDPDFGKLPKLLENSNPVKPVIISEMGGGARAGQRGSVQDLFTEDIQKWIYEQQTRVISSCQYIRGMSPWILYDFRCPRRLNRYQEGFNRKGLIDADRTTKKAAFTVLAQFYGTLTGEQGNDR